MAIINTPAGYYDRQPNNPSWKKILFKPGYPVQSAEMNEIQSVETYNFSLLASQLFSDGTYLSGGSIGISANPAGGLLVSIAAGTMYAGGYVHQIQAGTAVITGSGTETVSVLIADIIYTALSGVPNTVQDTTLNDPAIGAENYGSPGADRLEFSYTFAANVTTGVIIATFIDGQLITTSTANSLLDQILAILAQRTYEQSGSFLAEQPALTIADLETPASNPVNMQLTINGGIGYIEGVRQVNNKTFLNVLRPMTTTTRIAEPFTFLNDVTIYTLDNPPVLSVTTVQATIQSGNISMIRGGVVNGSDPIPSQYQPVASIVSAVAGDTTYVQGTDYALTGNYITWLSGGSQPSTGTSYTLVVQYVEDLTKAVRTLTDVTAESHTVTSSTTALSNEDISSISSLTRVSDSYAYVEGIDYTLATNTGNITWLNYSTNPVNDDVVQVNYSYWAHTTEGDFIARDSFVDSTGDILYYLSPTLSPDGNNVNYSSQIAFETSSGVSPVINSTVYLTYNYVLGRVDVLAWNVNGLLTILPGIPGLNPSPVTLEAIYCPIANIQLPPEAFASTTTIELYNNLTMTVNELRTLQQQVFNIQYNEAQFQLATNTATIQTPTDKIGIFADPMSTPSLANITDESFAGTFDFLARTFSLPRISGSAQPTVSSTTNATLYDDMYFTDFTEILSLQQPYESSGVTINEFGAINTQATINLSPPICMNVTTGGVVIDQSRVATTLTIDQLANSMLMTNIGPNSPLSQQIGAPYSSNSLTILNQIPVDSDWVESSWTTISQGSLSFATPPAANATTVVQNAWAQVLAAVEVVSLGSTTETTEISISGSNFRAGDRAISLTFDGVPLYLTATGSTNPDPNDAFPGCVEANASGEWTATFDIPAGTANGQHTIQIIARDALNLEVVSSYTSVFYTVGAYLEDLDVWVTLTAPPSGVECQLIPAYVLTEILGLGLPNAQVIAAVSSEIAYVIAYAIAQAVTQDVSLTTTLLETAITEMYSYTIYSTSISSDQISAIANAVDLTSTNVAANAQAIVNAVSSTTLPLGVVHTSPTGGAGACPTDPLAQTFTMSQDCFVSSIDLYFSIVPESNAQVGVAITTVDNGIPTQSYMGVTYLTGSECSTSTLTKFNFPKPIYLAGGTSYAFVILTSDTDAALYAAVLGQTDPTYGLIVQNPSNGALLQSPDAQTWQLIDGTDLKFNINTCSFSSNQSILKFGEITFDQDSSIFSFWMPYALPDTNTTVIYQYSLDNSTWIDFAPLTEVNLNASVGSIYIQILMNGTSSIAPTVVNSTQLLYYIWTSSGVYIHRQFDLPEAYQAEYIDVWVDTYIPGNTALSFQASFDSGSTWHDLSEVTADRNPITDTIIERHYTYDDGSADISTVMTRCNLSSTVSYVTPFITNYRVIAR